VNHAGAVLRPGRLYVGADDGHAVPCGDLADALGDLVAALDALDLATGPADRTRALPAVVGAAERVRSIWPLAPSRLLSAWAHGDFAGVPDVPDPATVRPVRPR
jgi:hypothetical protein